jgi:hypothetical protein
MASVRRWKATYASSGLRLVAVHLPRSAADRDPAVVLRAIEDHSIEDPCALDNDGVLAKRFDTGEAWPYYFLFDADGRLRSRAAGGMGLRLLENSMKRYLGTQDGG